MKTTAERKREIRERQRHLQGEQGLSKFKQPATKSTERMRKSRERQRQSLVQTNNLDLVTPHDVRDMTEKCQHCNTIFWKNEFCKKSCISIPD